MDRFFAIKEPTYYELPMEFLTTFNLEKRHINWTMLDTIQFNVHGERYQMSYTQFFIYIRFYTNEFIDSQEY